jgi:hypothetical protein
MKSTSCFLDTGACQLLSMWIDPILTLHLLTDLDTKPSTTVTPSWKLVPWPRSKHVRRTAGSAGETWDIEQEDFQTALTAAEETENTQGNIQDWLGLDEGDPALQLFFAFRATFALFIQMINPPPPISPD